MKNILRLSIKKPICASLSLLALVVFSIGLQSCSSDAPSDLALAITVVGSSENNPQGDGSGMISCVATAKNAVRYEYSFDGGPIIESVDGSIEHTFTKLGTHTYEVMVVAYSATEETESITQTVEVVQFGSTWEDLVFADEFDGDGAVDPTNWFSETDPPNNGSWWNGEKQHYTDRTDNAYVSDGTLKIVAKKESYTFGGSTKLYTSARLNSKFTFTYGRVEVKAKLPTGAGTWPAIWTLGTNITTVSWPKCGEIDIMEHWGHQPRQVSSAIHTEACSGVTGCPNVKLGEKRVEDYNEAFHVYAMEWTVDAIKFYIDDEFLYEYSPTVRREDNWPFDEDQFLLLNVAMGGEWFSIDPNFDQSAMEIDYVRIYQ